MTPFPYEKELLGSLFLGKLAIQEKCRKSSVVLMSTILRTKSKLVDTDFRRSSCVVLDYAF